MVFNPTKTVVHNEGCDLHYWYQGMGPMIIFVPGGNGHGRQYNPIIEALSDRFTCVTFDRRGMTASKVDISKRLNPGQQARDIRAVIKAMGFDKSIVFGSSLGGILGYVLALDHPEIIEHLITHEPPLSSLLPNHSAIFEWYLKIIEARDTKGWEAADAIFQQGLVGYKEDERDGRPCAHPERENSVNFFENELETVASYTPNLHRIKENGTSVGIMTGELSGDAFYALSTYEQAKILDCPRHDVPGYHQGFENRVEEFVPYFLNMLAVLEARKGI
ncbi:hypothetical protein DL769_003378 [Monosporascus sp. CRB-8-3]|nr:hypothetical protein DL769_003378 [Monosporascus sp. CRB-8-3]